MSYLEGMNEAQRQAVTHDPLIPLQILAGPGSGKTKVLTARIAHLVGHHKIAPQAIVAVTFTNKAAKEMRERLKKLIGDGKTSMLRMGTFHALCAKYLRIYGKRIFLPENFSICDADETKKIIKKLLKLPKHADVIANKRLHAEPRIIASFISKAKANGQSPEDVKSLIQSGDDKDIDFESVVAEIYSDYSEELRVTNCLDFDDLLMYGVKLFLKARDIGLKIRHVLVDEFQDTNVIQFQLMTLLASTKGVSIVGDPDQSIYGWRSADIENLSKMQTLFPETQQIYLEQNYRSTGSILAAASVIISGDKSRIQKTLFTAEQDGSKPTLREVAGENMEAECIAYEIKRLIAYSGGLLDYNDFAILLRFNALSRILEQVLQREGIPVRILGGHRFFDRMEVKDLISYLQLVDNPHNWFAFERAVNVPKRGMGDKSVQEILKRASAIGITPMDLCQRIVSGKAADIKPAVKRKITPFVDVIDTLSRLAVNEEYSAEELVLRLVAMIGYEEWLKTSQPADWEARWENVRELIKFAGESLRSESPQVEPQPTVTADNRRTSLIQNAETISPHRRSESNSHLEGDVIEENRSVTPLRKFLEDTSLLSNPDEEGRQEQEDQDKNSVPKVTISTCHSAKGLEWPVVFLPAVENWVFPFYKSEDVDEERRLLYVGCTRAQAFLYVSYCRDRDLQWLSRSSGPSPFLLLNRAKHVTNTAFSPKTPPLTMDEMALTSKILKRPPIDIITSRDRIQEFHKKNPRDPSQKEKEQDSITSQSHNAEQSSRSLLAPAWNTGDDSLTSFVRPATNLHPTDSQTKSLSANVIGLALPPPGTTFLPKNTIVDSCFSSAAQFIDANTVELDSQDNFPSPNDTPNGTMQSSALTEQTLSPELHRTAVTQMTVSAATVAAVDSTGVVLEPQPSHMPTPPIAASIPGVTSVVQNATYPTMMKPIIGSHMRSLTSAIPVPRGKRLGLGSRGMKPYQPPEKKARTNT